MSCPVIKFKQDNVKEKDFEILCEKLQAIARVKIWDKLYIYEENVISTEAWSYWQPLTRTLYNWCYGGADRKSLLKYLKQIEERVESVIQNSIEILSKPYVLRNFKNFGTMGDANKNEIAKLRKVQLLIPKVNSALEIMNKTYCRDNVVSKEIDVRRENMTEHNSHIGNFLSKHKL